MDKFIEVSKKIIPDILKVLERRYDILRIISQNNGIGRRKLSTILNLTERNIRSEIEILKTEKLIVIESGGVKISEKGKELLEDIEFYIKDIKGLTDLSEKIKELLGVKSVSIVPGDLNKDGKVLLEIGRKASEVLKEKIKPNYYIGVTGGSTIMEVSNQLEIKKKYEDTVVFPARGGLGEQLETQANTISAKIAEKLSGKYKLFYLPDNLDKYLFETFKTSDYIKEMDECLEKMDLLVFGIGRSDYMAEKRKLSEREKEILKEKKSVTESLGYFFDIEGKLILETKTIGLNIENFKKMKNLIGVAGGYNKGDSIISVSKLNKNIDLVIDEGASKRIIEVLQKV